MWDESEMLILTLHLLYKEVEVIMAVIGSYESTWSTWVVKINLSSTDVFGVVGRLAVKILNKTGVPTEIILLLEELYSDNR